MPSFQAVDYHENSHQWSKPEKNEYWIVSFICEIKKIYIELIGIESRMLVAKDRGVGQKGRCWSNFHYKMKFWRSEGRHGDYNEQHVTSAAAAAQSRQSCPTLCDPIDASPPGSPVPGILQARTLEWVAISFPSAWKWKVKVKSLSHVWLLATPWTAAYQAPPSMGFPRQEHWSGVPLPLCTSNLQKEYNLSFHTHTHNYVSWWMCDLTWLWWSFHNAYI